MKNFSTFVVRNQVFLSIQQFLKASSNVAEVDYFENFKNTFSYFWFLKAGVRSITQGLPICGH